jgi:hypothetical protein
MVGVLAMSWPTLWSLTAQGGARGDKRIHEVSSNWGTLGDLYGRVQDKYTGCYFPSGSTGITRRKYGGVHRKFEQNSMCEWHIFINRLN